LNNYDAISASIIVDGHTALRVGDMVNLTLPSTAQSKQTKDNLIDRFYRGAFLVRNIMHKFEINNSGNKHTIDMTCVADCVEEQIPFTDKNPVPKVYGKSNKKIPLTFNV